MSSKTENVVSTTEEVNSVKQQPTYTDRLISEFENSGNKKFTLEQIEGIIRNFSQAEYEKKKHTSDVIPFGKYKYKTVKDVVSFDKRYCEWLVKQDMLSNYEELKVALESALK